MIVLDDDGDIEMSVDSPSKPSSTPRRPTVAPLPDARSAKAQGKTFGMGTPGPLAYLPSPDLLNNFLSSLPPSNLPRGRRRDKQAMQWAATGPNDVKPKSCSRVNVRTVVTKLTNAEVTDDIKTVRDCENLLRNRRKIPIKYLQFCDNLRPGYYGKWLNEANPLAQPNVRTSLRHLDQVIRFRGPSNPFYERSCGVRLLL